MGTGSFIVRGTIDLRKLSAKLAVSWDPKIAAATIGGLVTENLERIPMVGDTIIWKGYHIEVLQADERRARLLHIRKK